MIDGGTPGANRAEPEPRALLSVMRGLRVLAEGRLSGLAIAPEEYLADIYCIQRVATLLAMELAAAGRSLRRAEAQSAGDEVQVIEGLLAAALDRRGVALDDCVIELAGARALRKDGGPV